MQSLSLAAIMQFAVTSPWPELMPDHEARDAQEEVEALIASFYRRSLDPASSMSANACEDYAARSVKRRNLSRAVPVCGRDGQTP